MDNNDFSVKQMDSAIDQLTDVANSWLHTIARIQVVHFDLKRDTNPFYGRTAIDSGRQLVELAVKADMLEGQLQNEMRLLVDLGVISHDQSRKLYARVTRRILRVQRLVNDNYYHDGIHMTPARYKVWSGFSFRDCIASILLTDEEIAELAADKAEQVARDRLHLQIRGWLKYQKRKPLKALVNAIGLKAHRNSTVSMTHALEKWFNSNPECFKKVKEIRGGTYSIDGNYIPEFEQRVEVVKQYLADKEDSDAS